MLILNGFLFVLFFISLKNQSLFNYLFVVKIVLEWSGILNAGILSGNRLFKCF